MHTNFWGVGVSSIIDKEGGGLAPRRKVLHRRVAETLATLYAENLEPYHLALGLHYAEGEVWDKAVVHLREAGTRAVKRSANREAAACFERALAALAHLPETQFTLAQAVEIRLELRVMLSHLGEVRQMLQHLREAEALAERLKDDRRRGQVCAFLLNSYSQLGELEQALVTGSRALEIARRLGDARLSALATTYLEQAHHYLGDYKRTVDLATGNLAALPADLSHEIIDGVWVSAFDRFWLVISLAELGRFAEAAEHQAEAFRLTEATQHPYAVGNAYRAAARLCLSQGDWSKARDLIEHAIIVLRRGSVVVSLGRALAESAFVLAQVGEASEALDRVRTGEQLLEQQAPRGNRSLLSASYRELGRAALLLSRRAEARRLGSRALDSSSDHPGAAAHALHLLGDIATLRDGFDLASAETYYCKALALAEPRGMRPLVAHCHLGLGKLYQRTDKRERACEHLTTAITMYRDMDMRFWLEQAEAEMRALT